MKFLVAVVLAFAAVQVAQADRDLSQFKPKDLHVKPERFPPFLPRIVGGQEAGRHQFPHQVALFIDGGSFCGGSILNARTILTAAHCADGARTIEVVAGAHNVQQSESTQQSIFSTDFVIHPEWDPNVIENDIALAKLPRALTIDDTCQPIELRAGDCKSTDLDGRQATVSGWGRPSDSSGSISPVLRHTSNNLLTNAACKQYFNIIKDTHICLDGSNGKGSCNGDSGGPLIVSEDETIREVGIVSFGSGWGCEIGFPSAYTRVACYTDWVKSNFI